MTPRAGRGRKTSQKVRAVLTVGYTKPRADDKRHRTLKGWLRSHREKCYQAVRVTSDRWDQAYYLGQAHAASYALKAARKMVEVTPRTR